LSRYTVQHDLRRDASREHIGGGLRLSVASPADLGRVLKALGREHDRERLAVIRRLIELDRGWGIES
jgi:hypothetical protein